MAPEGAGQSVTDRHELAVGFGKWLRAQGCHALPGNRYRGVIIATSSAA